MGWIHGFLNTIVETIINNFIRFIFSQRSPVRNSCFGSLIFFFFRPWNIRPGRPCLSFWIWWFSFATTTSTYRLFDQLLIELVNKIFSPKNLTNNFIWKKSWRYLHWWTYVCVIYDIKNYNLSGQIKSFQLIKGSEN